MHCSTSVAKKFQTRNMKDTALHVHTKNTGYDVMAAMNNMSISSGDKNAHTIEYFWQPMDSDENDLVLLRRFTEQTEMQYLNKVKAQAQFNNEGFHESRYTEEIFNRNDRKRMKPLDQFLISTALSAELQGPDSKETVTPISGSSIITDSDMNEFDSQEEYESNCSREGSETNCSREGSEANCSQEESEANCSQEESEADSGQAEYSNDCNFSEDESLNPHLESRDCLSDETSFYDELPSQQMGFQERNFHGWSQQQPQQGIYNNEQPLVRSGTGEFPGQQQQMYLQPIQQHQYAQQSQILLPNYYPQYQTFLRPVPLLPGNINTGVDLIQTLPVHHVQPFGMTNYGHYHPCPQISVVSNGTSMYQLDNQICHCNQGNAPQVMVASAPQLPQPIVLHPMKYYVNAPEFRDVKKRGPLVHKEKDIIRQDVASNSTCESLETKEASIESLNCCDEVNWDEDNGVIRATELIDQAEQMKKNKSDNVKRDISWVPNPYTNMMGGKLSNKAPNGLMMNSSVENLQDFGTTFFRCGEELPYVINNGMPRIQIKKSCPELKFKYYVPPMVNDNDNFGGQQIMWQAKMMQNFCVYLPHVWRLQAVPEFTRYKLDGWIHFSTATKFRFCCRSCIRPWTSMRGKVMIAFRLDPVTQQGTIFMKQFGQVCVQENCTDRNFQTPANYPEEIEQVMAKLSNYVGYIYYGVPLLNINNSKKGEAPVRSGNPRSLHLKELCQACFQGVCSQK